MIILVVQFTRTYALYGCSKKVAVWMAGVSAIILAVAIVRVKLKIYHKAEPISMKWSVTGQNNTVSVTNGCHAAISRKSSV